MDTTLTLTQFLSELREKGYQFIKIYTHGTEIKFVRLYSRLQRKPLMLLIPETTIIHCTTPDYTLLPIENDYHNYRQCEYLKNIALDDVMCGSKYNLCVKSANEYTCYLIEDVGIDELEEPVSDDESLIADLAGEESDVEIDDYPVQDIFPVFWFKQPLLISEETIIENYTFITNAEEEMNELQVEQLLKTFEKQMQVLKGRIYQIHKDTFNTRRDIEQASEKLARVYLLREQSTGEKDRVRFKIDRLATEVEEKIDALNVKLREQRNSADLIMSKYWKYIEKFDTL